MNHLNEENYTEIKVCFLTNKKQTLFTQGLAPLFILFDSPQGQGGAQLGIYQINYIMPSPLSLLLFINYLFIFCKERLFLI